jgi:carbon-monoxide dehydrogenase small subunit
VEGVFKINGTERLLRFSASSTLLSVLRENGHTEVKEGCAEGQCGACLILLEGRLINSCQVFAASAMGKEILTVRGLGDIHNPHPIQRAFVETGAIQCGYCTPGMILATYALLQESSDPSREEIRRALDGNLCRCTGYEKIVDAVMLAAERMRSSHRTGEHA